MAKQRIINTRFWDDSYIVNLASNEKLLFLYLITNPLTNISGVYELPLSRVVFDTGISRREVDLLIQKLERDGKIIRETGWVAVVNFIKYQTLNPKVKQGICNELIKAPKTLRDKLSIDYAALGISYNSRPHINLNQNSKPVFASSQGFSTDLSTTSKSTRRLLSQKMKSLFKQEHG